MLVNSSHVILQHIYHTPLDQAAVIAYLGAFYILCSLTFRRPIYGLAGLLLIEPFALYRDVGATTLTLPKIALAAVAIGLLLRRTNLAPLSDKKLRPLLIAMIAVIATTAISFFQADYAVPVIRETLKAMEYLLVFSVAVVAYAADPDENVVRNTFYLVGFMVSILAIAQEFTFAPAGMWIGGHAVPRIAGPLEGPNQLSAYLGLLLPVFAVLLLRSRITPWALGVVTVTVCAEILTLSRAGVASCAIAVLAVFWRSDFRRNAAAAFLIPVGIAVAAVALFGGEVSRFWSTQSQFQPSGLGTRAQLWKAAYLLWRQHPVLGIGAGNYELELAKVGYPGIHTHSNSAYIQALVEGGIPELLSVIYLAYTSVASFARRNIGGPLAVGAFGASLGFAVHQIMDYLVFYPKVGILWYIILGLGAAEIVLSAKAGRSSAPLETVELTVPAPV